MNGFFLLCAAIEFATIDVLKSVLDMPQSSDMRNKFVRNALKLAVKTNNTEKLQIIRDKQYHQSKDLSSELLRMAIDADNTGMVALILARMTKRPYALSDRTFVRFYKPTILQEAVLRNNPEVVRAILDSQYGGSTALCIKQPIYPYSEESALGLAVSKGYTAVIDVIFVC